MNWKDNKEELQEKFWNGESSLEEERLLKSHFQQNDEDNVLAHYFDYVRIEGAITYQGKPAVKSIKLRSRASYSIAASVAILVAAFFLLDPSASNNEAYVAQSPEEALEITQKTFAFINSKVNRSNDLIFNSLNEYNKINFIK